MQTLKKLLLLIFALFFFLGHSCLGAPTNVIIEISRDYHKNAAYKFLENFVWKERFKIALYEVGQQGPIQRADASAREDFYSLWAINWDRNAKYELRIELAKCGSARYRQTIVRPVLPNAEGQYGTLIDVSILPLSTFGTVPGENVETPPSNVANYERAMESIASACQLRRQAVAECEWAQFYVQIGAKLWVEGKPERGDPISAEDKELWRLANEAVEAFYKGHFAAQETALLALTGAHSSSFLMLPQTMEGAEEVEEGPRKKQRHISWHQQLVEEGEHRMNVDIVPESAQSPATGGTFSTRQRRTEPSGSRTPQDHDRHSPPLPAEKHGGGIVIREEEEKGGRAAKKSAKSKLAKMHTQTKSIAKKGQAKKRKGIAHPGFTPEQLKELEGLRQEYRENPSWEKPGWQRERNKAYNRVKEKTKLKKERIYAWMKKQKEIEEKGRGKGANVDDDGGFLDKIPMDEHGVGDDMLDYAALEGPHNQGDQAEYRPSWKNRIVSDDSNEEQEEGDHHGEQYLADWPPPLAMATPLQLTGGPSSSLADDENAPPSTSEKKSNGEKASKYIRLSSLSPPKDD